MDGAGGYLVFAATLGASVVAPGPDVLAVVGRALGSGARACVPLVLGIACGKLALMSLALLGLAALAVVLGPLFAAVKLAGALYLVWLGVKFWRRPPIPINGAASVMSRPGREVAVGMAMAMANPLAVLFYAAVLPSVVDVGAVTAGRYAVLCAIIVTVTAAGMGAYALGAGALGRVFNSPAARRRVNRSAGAAMIGAGVAIAVR